MASARKKQDEKHLKILRNLVSVPSNRQCFDCHQRGPTYVNMTIGSFVCTSCSGLLRGLTPPHRVKSISMATFTPEEIELVSARGNEYCRRIWLGLYEPGRVNDTRDEQGIKDFMIAKYEKKRYYLDPSMANLNGAASTSQVSASSSPLTSTTNASSTSSVMPPTRPLTSLVGSITLPALSTACHTVPTTQNAFTPDDTSSGFLVDFGSLNSTKSTASANKIDPFGVPPTTGTSNNTNSNSNFADFDNNPIFDAPNETDLFGSIPLESFGSASGQTSTFPLSLNGDAFSFSSKSNPIHWSIPTSQSFPGVSRKSSSGSAVNTFQQPPAEDRYAALKDLDFLMKTQQSDQNPPTSSTQSDWTQASPAPSWSAFGSSPQTGGSAFGSSPQTGGFLSSAFPSENNSVSGASNPFIGPVSSPWSVADSPAPNPFLSGQSMQTDQSLPFAWNGGGSGGGLNGTSMNGFHVNPSSFPTSQSLTFPTKSWNSEQAGNPFVLGSSSNAGSHSNNPFL